MVKENFIGQMEVGMKEILKTINNMEKVSFFIRMVPDMKDSSRME